MSPRSRVVSASSDIALDVYTTDALDQAAFYLLVAKHKEKYMFRQVYNISQGNAKKNDLNQTLFTIPSSSLIYAGAYEVILYRIKPAYLTYFSGAGTSAPNTLQSISTI